MRATIIHSLLAAAALAAWAVTGKELTSRADLDVPLNVMGINRSPYGEVIALAVQGPIDQSFQIGMFGIKPASEKEISQPAPNDGPVGRFSVESLLSRFDTISKLKTSKGRISQAHSRYLRREAEKQLRFAYQLDPSQYSNYNSLHFFLTEPAVGTRSSLTPEAAALARDTIHYCMGIDHDPRPALTAAAACTNMLHLMFADHNHGSRAYTTGDMRAVLQTLTQAIQRFDNLSNQWHRNGNWELLSPQRVQECADRLEFILKIQHAAEATIAKFESTSSNPTTTQ